MLTGGGAIERLERHVAAAGEPDRRTAATVSLASATSATCRSRRRSCCGRRRSCARWLGASHNAAAEGNKSPGDIGRRCGRVVCPGGGGRRRCVSFGAARWRCSAARPRRPHRFRWGTRGGGRPRALRRAAAGANAKHAQYCRRQGSAAGRYRSRPRSGGCQPDGGWRCRSCSRSSASGWARSSPRRCRVASTCRSRMARWRW